MSVFADVPWRQPDVEVRFARPVPGYGSAWARRVVSGVLKMEKATGYALSVYVTGNREIRRINRRHLKHDYATDVISFPYGGEAMYPSWKRELGEVVVSAEMARVTAKSLGIPIRQEFTRYLVHGTLHLLGYDDKKPCDRKKMYARQEAILKKVLSA